tara:strand:- start:4230 stop:5039 length:810 start_codon:yes stop_codon:yes gene_type:complete
MLENEKIDILSICTHPESHEEIVKTAVHSGVKMIFCEKPLSNTLNSAKRILEDCKNHNTKLAVNHFRRSDNFFIHLKNNIQNNFFGKIQHLNFYYTRGIANSGSHLFDLIRFLFGDILSITPISSFEEIYDDPTISCILELNDNLFCNLIGLNGENYRIFDLEIFGSNSKISIDTSKNIRFYNSKASARSSEFNELYRSSYPKLKKYDKQIFLSSLSNLINAIENKDVLNCDGNDGYKSLELIIGTKLSFKMKEKIKFPLDKIYFETFI